MASLAMLHAVNHRLTNLPVKQLPPLAASLASSLSNCGDLLSAPHSQKASKADSDNALQVHKLMTRLSSLLQDRTVEGRWTAVVLVKAVVEAGQWEVLRGCEQFARGLIAILAKPDPSSTKKMCIITLTRIFHLTYQYPTLVREITTPSLPGFITSALNTISVKPSSEPTRKLKPNAPLLETVLHALNELIARHPTIFRPFSAQIYSLLQGIIGATSPAFSESVVALAQRLFVSLHNCAPKNTSSDEWKSACHMTIASAHETAHFVFRAVVEQWESVDPALRHFSKAQSYGQEISGHGPDALGLSNWQGVHAGVDRLTTLLRMISSFFDTPTVSTVSLPIGAILDLTSRLMSVTVPGGGSDIQANPQVGRTEREELFAELPRIHTACMNLLLTFAKALEAGVIPVAQTILEQTLWVFRAEKFSREVRSATYDLVQGLLAYMGPTMTKQGVSSLNSIIRTCCTDLLPPAGDQTSPADPASGSKGKTQSHQTTANADSFLNPKLKQTRPTDTSPGLSAVKQSAQGLLPQLLTHLPTEYLSPSLRAEIDRTIILVADKNAMLASVLNPVPATRGRGVGSSIIPFLARSHASEMDVEALIRPRMPVLMNHPGYHDIDEEEEEEEEEEEDNQKETAPDSAAAQTGFLQPSTTPILRPGRNYNTELDTAPQQQQQPPPTKRSYEAPKPQPAPAPQSKKPRVEETNSPDAAVSSQPSLRAASPSTFTGTAAISVPSPSSPDAAEVAPPAHTESVSQASTAPFGGPVSGTSVAEQGPSAAVEEDGESDDEVPALNVDPDTDDEDEDEDVAMAG